MTKTPSAIVGAVGRSITTHSLDDAGSGIVDGRRRDIFRFCDGRVDAAIITMAHSTLGW